MSMCFFSQITTAGSRRSPSLLPHRSVVAQTPTRTKAVPLRAPVVSVPQERDLPGLSSEQIKNLTVQEYEDLSSALNEQDSQEYADLLEKVLDRMELSSQAGEPQMAPLVKKQKEKSVVLDKKDLFKGFVESDGIEKYMRLYLLGKPDGFVIADPGKSFFSEDYLRLTLIAMNRGMALLRTAQSSSLIEPSFWQAQKINWNSMKQFAQEYIPVIKPSKIVFTGKERLRQYYRAKKLVDLAEAMHSLATRIERELIKSDQKISTKSFLGSLRAAKLAFKALSDYAKDQKGNNIDFTDDQAFTQIGQRGVIILDAVAKKLLEAEPAQ